MGKVSAT